MDESLALNAEEEKKLDDIFADPQKKAKFLAEAVQFIDGFEQWYEFDQYKERKTQEDIDMIQKLRALIARF